VRRAAKVEPADVTQRDGRRPTEQREGRLPAAQRNSERRRRGMGGCGEREAGSCRPMLPLRAISESQARTAYHVGPGTVTMAVGPDRARVVLFSAGPGPAHRAQAKWPSILYNMDRGGVAGSIAAHVTDQTRYCDSGGTVANIRFSPPSTHIDGHSVLL
jgi:hypothetical protein